MPRLHPEEKTLRDQARGILREALDGPGLREEDKERLRGLISKHPEQPERALLEHLRVLREVDRAELLAS
ncbi:hypothetical protein LK10_02360 [Sinomonas humi]|uniref:Uncharacterized protein n=2 Tax=Sinomonas humi TaxID=1338436 RepID=A0A0B2AP08_9MICC|nr:hypothetical protein LK10_02360 [Sinomonas humi]